MSIHKSINPIYRIPVIQLTTICSPAEVKAEPEKKFGLRSQRLWENGRDILVVHQLFTECISQHVLRRDCSFAECDKGECCFVPLYSLGHNAEWYYLIMMYDGSMMYDLQSIYHIIAFSYHLIFISHINVTNVNVKIWYVMSYLITDHC